MKKLNVEQTKEMLLQVCDAIIRSKPLLTEVDSRIGDGDHGIGMAGGMEEAKEVLQDKEYQDINGLFKATGMAMLNTMGGASGVIFGSMFLGGIKGMEALKELDGRTFARIMRGSLEAVKLRGGAEVGDKTMVDAFEPAVLAMEAADSDDLEAVLRAGSAAAAQGVEDSKNCVAKFGKARYLGERAIGHQDAGATSISIMIGAMHRYCE